MGATYLVHILGYSLSSRTSGVVFVDRKREGVCSSQTILGALTLLGPVRRPVEDVLFCFVSLTHSITVGVIYLKYRFLTVLEAGKCSKWCQQVGLVLHHHIQEVSHGKTLLTKHHAIIGAPPSWPLLTLITSQSPSSQHHQYIQVIAEGQKTSLQDMSRIPHPGRPEPWPQFPGLGSLNASSFAVWLSETQGLTAGPPKNLHLLSPSGSPDAPVLSSAA